MRCAGDGALAWRLAGAADARGGPALAAPLAQAVAAAARDGALRSELAQLCAALCAASAALRDALCADLARRAAAAPYGCEAAGGLLASLAPLLALGYQSGRATHPLGPEPDALVAACASALRSPRCASRA